MINLNFRAESNCGGDMQDMESADMRHKIQDQGGKMKVY